MSKAGACKTIKVKNRLGEKLARPGGISRSEAVATATAGVETLRKEYLNRIPGEIEALEAIVAVYRDGIPPAGVQKLLDRAGRLLVLSGTFGYDLLDAVVKRFCDLGLGMIEKGITAVAPLEVHLRTMWLVSPCSPVLSDAESLRLMSELSKIHAYYELKRDIPDAPQV